MPNLLLKAFSAFLLAASAVASMGCTSHTIDEPSGLTTSSDSWAAGNECKRSVRIDLSKQDCRTATRVILGGNLWVRDVTLSNHGSLPVRLDYIWSYGDNYDYPKKGTDRLAPGETKIFEEKGEGGTEIPFMRGRLYPQPLAPYDWFDVTYTYALELDSNGKPMPPPLTADLSCP